VRNYPQVNRDLLLTGAFLHDIGKLHELTYHRSIAYTTKGQLLGHMIIELEMLHEKLARLPGFPEELKVLIEHLIISHHGEYAFGSPKLPMFPEALMLHYLDDLDSKMESMRAQFAREAELETPWTSYNPSLARPLLDTKKFLEKGLAGSRMMETQKAGATAAANAADLAQGSDEAFSKGQASAEGQLSPVGQVSADSFDSRNGDAVVEHPATAGVEQPVGASAASVAEQATAPQAAGVPANEKRESGEPSAASTSATSSLSLSSPSSSPSSSLAALQRKFESHKVTPNPTAGKLR
jgi:hypothetical protein